MYFIAFNHYSTTHNYSVSVLGKTGLYTFPLERFDRVKKSPKRLGVHFGQLSPEQNKQYYSNIIREIQDIIPLGSKVILINTPKGIDLSRYDIIKNISINNHHLMHAASAYYASGYKKACIISIDGFGNENNNYINFISQSIWYGEKGKIQKISSKYHKKHQIGIGMTYSLISKHIVGFEAGSTMGLSSYGNHNRFNGIDIFEKIDGLESFLHSDFLQDIPYHDGILFCDNPEFLSQFKKNCKKIFGIEENEEDKDITESIYADIAAKLQYDTEKAILSIAMQAYKNYPTNNLCLAGGSALNVIVNTKILKYTPFENIFVQPAATDDGLSLGAAYLGYFNFKQSFPLPPFLSASLGKKYSGENIFGVIKKFENKVSYISFKKEIIADKICNGKIIAIFTGRSEFGPRALGNRSIIADASSKEIAKKVNIIKKRETWRPLAPMLLTEDLEVFFPESRENYFMTHIGYANNYAQEKIPGVIHIDNTARYQTLEKHQNEKMFHILQEIKKIKGNSVILNTSFNSSGEPIIESPEDAIRMFLSTNIDYLVLEDYIVSKNKIYPEYGFNPEKNINEQKQKLGIL